MKMKSRTFVNRRYLYISKLLCTIIVVICIIILFSRINQHFTTNRPWSLNNTINTLPCDQNVRVYNPDGTMFVVQRCYPLLINFAEQCCQKVQQQSCHTGLKLGVRQCLKMNMNIFDNDQLFYQKNKHILERKRGAGYWLWKPYILQRELYIAKEGDIIIYSDAAVDVIDDVGYLVNLTQSQDVITFKQHGAEYSRTKRDAFIVMNADRPSYYNSSCGVASYIILRKSLASMRFVSEWLTYAQDSRVLTDDRNVLNKKNYNGFLGHRHDQSILSLLAKKWNLIIYPDPSQWGEGGKRPYPTIFNHHRSKD